MRDQILQIGKEESRFPIGYKVIILVQNFTLSQSAAYWSQDNVMQTHCFNVMFFLQPNKTEIDD